MRLGTPDLTQLLHPEAVLSTEHGVEADTATGTPGTPGTPGTLDNDEQQGLILNLDASLRVHTRPHFFSWTQGMLQSLIRHEVLICALRSGEPLSLSVDSFAVNVADPSAFSDAFLRDAPVAPALLKSWEERRFRPLVCEVGDVKALAGGTFAGKLERIRATRLIAHGTHNSEGLMESFFTFACIPEGDVHRQAYLAQLLVPFLHAAWVRTRMNVRAKGNDAPKSLKRSAITTREQEILRWIYLGKSNFEIGTILSISPLTVKNHVQKILRKLNVVNRAQAVGKALDLRLLSP